jgi:methylenetetrahydrofolate reductase (NADPH)
MNSTAPTNISFEFFPPRDEKQQQKLESASQKLALQGPEYFSVTFGAGGSSLTSTRETVLKLNEVSGVPAAPHISCMAPDRDSIRQLLEKYRQAGISRLIVLRGDRPEGVHGPGPFQFANELLAFIRSEFGSHFHVQVACYPEFHPESDSPASELKYFRQKVNAGADGAITQYFFNPDSYFRFVDDCRSEGINLPITPGIMPITNYHQLARFSDICGAEIPRWIRRRLEQYGDDVDSIREFGAEVITCLCEKLLAGGAPGLHFYTLNRANATLRILHNLNPERVNVKPAMA